MGFLKFIVNFAYIGIAIALIGIVVFARYRKYEENTGNNSMVQKVIGIALFVLGALWVISPVFINAMTGNL